MQITITEALAEIKTLSQRVEKREQGIQNYIVRDSRLRDPLEQQGGSVEFVRRERQAIRDMMDRMLRIRTGIQKVNLSTSLTVEGTTRTVQEWLNWRREIAPRAEQHLNRIVAAIGTARRYNRQAAGAAVSVPEEAVCNVNETELHAEIENHQKVLGTLDGKLSLVNATVMVDAD